MLVKTCDTFTCEIFIAGDYDKARDATRRFCMERGDCYAVERVAYIYTGGEEAGVRVTRINYPRFPLTQAEIWERAHALAARLQDELCQSSYSIVGADRTEYVSAREREA